MATQERSRHEGSVHDEAFVLDELVATEPGPSEAGVPLVGEVVDVRHPVRAGCVLVALRGPDGREVQRWLPSLQGLAIRASDRVLVVRPANALEPVVIGVIDGLAPRPEPRRAAAATIALLPD